MPDYELCSKGNCPARSLVTLYKVSIFDEVDFLQKVTPIWCKIKTGGIVDVDDTARIVLHGWNEGIYIYYSFQRAN